jgi:hypothetical protein
MDLVRVIMGDVMTHRPASAAWCSADGSGRLERGE